MRLQDLFPYDSTKFEYDGVFEPIGSEALIIRSNCVWVRFHILVTGNTYFFFTLDEEKDTTGTAVYFIDFFYHMDMIYLLIQDAFTHEIKLLNPTLDNGLALCNWRLVDSYTIDKMIEAKYFI